MPIKTFLASLTLSLIVGCAGQTTQDLPSGWSVVPDIGVFDFSHRVNGITQRPPGVSPAPNDWHILYLTKTQSGRWEASRTGEAGRAGTEAIWLDPQQKQIGLAAAGTALQTNGQAASVCENTVDYDRPASGYLACNSALVSEVKDLGVVFTPLRPLMAMTGTKITAFKADVPKLAAALSGVDLDTVSNEMTAIKTHQKEAAKEQYRQQQLAREAAVRHFQATATTGTKTLCGLIVDTRKDLVEVQLDGTGGQRQWTGRANIQPQGSVGPSARLRHCTRTYY